MNMFQRLDIWHKTKTGLAVFGLLEAGLAYVFASWAIDSGSLIDWFLAIVLAVGTLQNLVKFILKVSHSGREN